MKRRGETSFRKLLAGVYSSPSSLRRNGRQVLETEESPENLGCVLDGGCFRVDYCLSV